MPLGQPRFWAESSAQRGWLCAGRSEDIERHLWSSWGDGLATAPGRCGRHLVQKTCHLALQGLTTQHLLQPVGSGCTFLRIASRALFRGSICDRAGTRCSVFVAQAHSGGLLVSKKGRTRAQKLRYRGLGLNLTCLELADRLGLRSSLTSWPGWFRANDLDQLASAPPLRSRSGASR